MDADHGGFIIFAFNDVGLILHVAGLDVQRLVRFPGQVGVGDAGAGGEQKSEGERGDKGEILEMFHGSVGLGLMMFNYVMIIGANRIQSGWTRIMVGSSSLLSMISD